MEYDAERKLINGKAFIRVNELMEFLDISRSLAYQLVAEGQFFTVKISSTLRVRSDSVYDFCERQACLSELEKDDF